MSADSDLLFPQADALAITDLGHLPEYEDFAKHLFSGGVMQGSGIDSVPGSGFLLDLEGKSDVSLLSMGEFDDFITFSTIAEEEEEDDGKDAGIDSRSFLFSSQGNEEGYSTESIGTRTMRSSISKSGYGGLCNGVPDIDVGMDREETIQMPSLCQAEVGLPSPKTMIATSKLNCLNLNDLIAAAPVVRMPSDPGNLEESFSTDVPALQAGSLAFSSTSPVGLASPSELLAAKVCGTQGFISSNSSIANSSLAIESSSPVSSRAILASSDGTCTVGTETSSLSLNDLVNGVLIQVDNINDAQRASSARQSAGVAPLTDCACSSGGYTRRLNVFENGHESIPPHVVEGVSQFPSIQRSHSSHALGQISSPAHGRALYEDVRISTVPKPVASVSGLSNVSELNKVHLTDLQEMNARPSSVTSIRRVYSTGDLQIDSMQGCNGEQFCYGGSSPLPVELPNVEEGCIRIGHYTLEERRMKLHRYRQKRTERNFNKKIKYVCRKTLADSRPRIRGRFARSDEVAEPGVKPNGIHHDEEDGEEYTWNASRKQTCQTGKFWLYQASLSK